MEPLGSAALSPDYSTSNTAFSASQHSDSRFSQASKRFRESTHLIPSPDAAGRPPKPYNPLMFRLVVIIGTPLIMFGLGLALEIGIFLSNKFGGFKVPTNNVFSFFSAQFLLSFFPTLLIIPVAFMWRELDWHIRWYHPYIVLFRGNAPAEESILLDYITQGPLLSLFRALKYKHRIVFWSALTATITYGYQPLAGSIFQIRQSPQTDKGTVTSTKDISLAPDVLDLNAFVAAAGFAEAAVLHGLGDPPFIQGGWATAEFKFPTYSGLNGSMTVNTTGIQTKTNCSNPSEPPVLTPIDGTNNFTLSSKSIDGCTHSLTFNPTTSSTQYGVDNVSCGDTANLDVTFQPVMFWYFHEQSDGTPQAKTVFCKPTIQAFNVLAAASLNDGSLINVTLIDTYVTPNNVTGGDLAGKAFNGVIFDNSPNPFIQARATATRSGVPGAVFRFAVQLPNGPQSTFDLPNGFLDITSKVYTQHLSISAKSIYFVNQNDTLPATVVSLLPRLWIDPLPAHALALFLLFTGFIGLFLHIINRRQRRNLLLAAPPGSIASVTALTSRSGFGDLLLPYDDELTLERKLEGLRFRLDRRTGAILAEEDERGAGMGPGGVGMKMMGMGSKSGKGKDDATTALLAPPLSGKEEGRSQSSSDLAYQAAAGYPPWVLKTPYDRDP